jgi:hypothetical protein
VEPLLGAWTKDDVVIVSNGACGSSCGEFVRALRDSVGVKVYSYSNPYGDNAFPPTSFEGGSVYSFDRYRTDAQQIAQMDWKIMDAIVPPLFSRPVRGTLPFWESYSPNEVGAEDDVPLEWKPHVADGYIRVEDVLNKEQLWAAVVQKISGLAVNSVTRNKRNKEESVRRRR